MSAIRDAVHESLERAIKADSTNITAKVEGRAIVRKDLESALIKIEDHEVRSMVRLLVRNPDYNDMSVEEVERIAVDRLRKTVELSEKDKDAIVARAVDDMRSSKVDEDTILAVSNRLRSSSGNMMDAMKGADDAIISERVRRERINAIIKSISDKGFIVDKKNIRMLRETNTVRMTAVKPGGQRAEFNVNLDGSFIYKFDDFEGQTCQKDIKPFMTDLESVYGIKITNVKEDWANPDKNAKMNYQTMDVMRNN
jgi:hypothetical protein